MGQFLFIGFIKSIHLPKSSNYLCSEVKLREEMGRRFNMSLFNETVAGDEITWHIKPELFSDINRVAEFLERQWVSFFRGDGSSVRPLDPDISEMTAAVKACRSYNDLAELAVRPYPSYLFQDAAETVEFGENYAPLAAKITCQTFINTGKVYMEEWSNLFAYLEQALKAAYVDYDCAKAIRMFLL
ncbi:MAG: hypothetical protein NTZ90_04275 [Proteobacteria bacterium]|nr:hypothetical protein [Pseudomonadota bacterium]